MKLAYKNQIIIAIIGLLSASCFALQAQNTLSESERQRIIQQVKKEVLEGVNIKYTKPLGQISDGFTVSGYLEAYYSYDFENPDSHNRPNFMYSHNRHNEITVNLGFIKTAYQTDKARANLAVAVGTYMNSNYAAEPTVMKNIYEANVGVKISKKQNLWIDAGVMPSHIGFESAIGKDNWTLTRGIYAENSPYFNTGAKISYTSPDEKWLLSGLVLNGWQRIQRVDGNSLPAFGHQLTYKPNSKITLNSSSFVGSDKTDSLRQMRYFHNLYGIFQIDERFGITVGIDFGAEQKSNGSKSYNSWLTPVLLIKANATDKVSFTIRGEYYKDAGGVIIATNTTNNFQTFGYSLNCDYQIHDNIVWRIEGRGLNSKDEIFIFNNKPSKNNYFVTTAIAFSF